MLGLGFGVQHIPGTLPDVVFALFSGLNAAAVGLITLAAYDLSSKVITDPLTRIEVLLSAAFASCYQSQWLYPVLMVAGGVATLMLDMLISFRDKRKALRQTQRLEESPRASVEGVELATPDNIPIGEDIEMQDVKRPEPVATPPALPSRIENGSVDRQRSNAEHKPSTLTHRRSGVGQDAPALQHQIKPDVSEPEQSLYFSLSVRNGLFMSVTRSEFNSRGCILTLFFPELLYSSSFL